jgi:pimeloyl-ACP methyl ester carboxylesterase
MTMIPSYRTASVDGLKVFYREAGDAKSRTLLLLHGFPTSSHMFRELIPALADRYRVVAPDLPGFGFTDAADRASFKYSFDHLAEVIDRFTEVLGLSRYAIYVFDYGAPVGFRLAIRHPERITAVISQNGNAKNDPFFLPAGAQAFKRDHPDAEIHLLEAGHFALESQGPEIAAIIRDFLERKLPKQTYTN